MSSHTSSEEIRRDIERTRGELSETVDAIQDRLQPDNLRRQAQEAIQDTLTDTADSIVDYVSTNRAQLQSSLIETAKRNPLPTLLIGAGVGWLLMDMLSSSSDRKADYPIQRYDQARAREAQRVSRYDSYTNEYQARQQGYGPADAYRSYEYRETGGQGSGGGWAQEALHTAQEKVAGVADTVREAAAQAGSAVQDAAASLGDKAQSQAEQIGHQVAEGAGRVGGTVQEHAGQVGHQVAEGAGRVGGTVQEQAGQVGHQAQAYARYAQRTTQQTISDNPLLFGAIALGVGAAVALMLPHTRQEDEWLGETSDQVTERARAAAEDVAQRAQAVVKEVAPEVKQAAQKVVEEVKQTGQESLEKVKESTLHAAEQVQDKTQATVKSEAEKARQDVETQTKAGVNAVKHNISS
jgi:gas vesicle protein